MTSCSLLRAKAVAIAAALIFQGPTNAADGLASPVASQVAAAERAAAKEPSNAARVGAVGQLLHAYEQLALADLWYKRAQTIDRKSAEWPYLRGVLAFVQGDPDSAIAHLNEALRRSPTDTTVLLRIAEYQQSRGNLIEAKAAAETVLRLSPQATPALYRLGRIALDEGRQSDAIPLLIVVAQAIPDHSETQYALALAYRRLGRSSEAEIHEQRFRTLPQSRSSWNDPYMQAVASRRTAIPQTFVETALEHERKGEFAPAIRSNKQALQLDSDFVQAHINLVSAYGKLGDGASVTLHYQAALRLAPRSFELHYNHGVFLLNAGKLAEAEVAFRTACDLNPQSAAAYQNLGHTLELQMQPQAAVEWYKKALTIEPGYRLSHLHLGRWYLRSGSPDLADYHLRKALAVKDQEDPKYTYLVANVHYQAGDRERAKTYAKRAYELALRWNDAKLAEQISRALALLSQ